MIGFIVGTETFQLHDGDRFVEIGASALVFTRMRTDTPTGMGQWHRLSRCLQRIIITQVPHSLDIGGNVDMCRTGIHAGCRHFRNVVDLIEVIIFARLFVFDQIHKGIPIMLHHIEQGLWNCPPDFTFGCLHHRTRNLFEMLEIAHLPFATGNLVHQIVQNPSAPSSRRTSAARFRILLVSLCILGPKAYNIDTLVENRKAVPSDESFGISICLVLFGQFVFRLDPLFFGLAAVVDKLTAPGRKNHSGHYYFLLTEMVQSTSLNLSELSSSCPASLTRSALF